MRPSIVFLDEVTVVWYVCWSQERLHAFSTSSYDCVLCTGLDSHNARVVMEVGKRVATSGPFVIMTVHQPSSRLFELMDQVIILNKGPCLYQGPSSVLPAYPDERGYGVPPNYNPVDWAIEVSETVALQTLGEEGFMRDFLGSEPPNCKDRDVKSIGTGLRGHPLLPARRDFLSQIVSVCPG